MSVAKKSKLDLGELDISIIECEDDKEFNRNLLDVSGDDLINSISRRSMAKSTTKPLMFNDEE